MTTLQDRLDLATTCPSCPRLLDHLIRYDMIKDHATESGHDPLRVLRELCGLADSDSDHSSSYTPPPPSTPTESSEDAEDDEKSLTEGEKMRDHLARVDDIVAITDDLVRLEKSILPFLELEMVESHVYDIWSSLIDEQAKLETLLAWALRSKEDTTIGLFTSSISKQVAELNKQFNDWIRSFPSDSDDEDDRSDTTFDTEMDLETGTESLVDESLAEKLEDLNIELEKVKRSIKAVEELKDLWETYRSPAARAAARGDWLTAMALSTSSSASASASRGEAVARELVEKSKDGGAKTEAEIGNGNVDDHGNDTAEKIREEVSKLQV